MQDMDLFTEVGMKLAVSIYTIQQLNMWIDHLDCAILNHESISLIYQDLDLDEAIRICNVKKVQPILAMNKMIYASDFKMVEDILLKYKEYTFLITDIAVYSIAKKHNLENHLIFDPQTMITNYKDLEAYSQLGFDAVSMSLEIPYADVLESIEKTKANVFYQAFGHRMMFYSKRKLISLYKEKARIEVKSSFLYLMEEKRDELLPIIENKNGTMIFRSYLISLAQSIVNTKIKYAYMESLYIKDEIFQEALKLYSALNRSEISIEQFHKCLLSLNLDIQDGFTYQDSVYQKELF